MDTIIKLIGVAALTIIVFLLINKRVGQNEPVSVEHESLPDTSGVVFSDEKSVKTQQVLTKPKMADSTGKYINNTGVNATGPNRASLRGEAFLQGTAASEEMERRKTVKSKREFTVNARQVIKSMEAYSVDDYGNLIISNE